MDPRVRAVVADKRILVFGEMLRAVRFPKTDELLHYMSTGFPLSGEYPLTDIFPGNVKEASLKLDDLYVMRENVRAEVMASCRSSSCDEIDDELYEINFQKVAKE